MPEVGIKELLEAGVHFGHQTRRWNPKMRRFIFGERGGIYIIDLLKTQELLNKAQTFAGDVADKGGTVLFVGTKKQARDAVKETAEAAGMPYVNHRWLGGLLTNWNTISKRISRLHDLERYQADGQLELLPTKERMTLQADLAKLQANLGGVKNMARVPDAMFVVDLKTEVIAVREAQRLRIPIIGLVDTNCDPDGISYVVPGNDDAIRSCALVTKAIGERVQEGAQKWRIAEEQAKREAEEKARREEEERQRREAEEQARREAEEQARREAEEAARAEAAADQAQPTEAEAAQTQAQAPAGSGDAPAQVEGRRRAPRRRAAAAAKDVAETGAEVAKDVAEGATETAKDVAKDAAGTAAEVAKDVAEGVSKAIADATGGGEDAEPAEAAKPEPAAAEQPAADTKTDEGTTKTEETSE
jgi:small subunit ribosomal protein S2